jgi:hypothetical protein
MLGPGDDGQLTQRSTMCQLLGLYEQPNTFPNSAHLVSRIAQTQQNSRGKPVVFGRTFWNPECCAIVGDRRMQRAHGLTEQCDRLGVMTKVRADNALSKQACSVLVIATTRNIGPHRTNIALLSTAGPDHLIALETSVPIVAAFRARAVLIAPTARGVVRCLPGSQSLGHPGPAARRPSSARRRAIIDAHAPYPWAYGGKHRLVSRFVPDRV